MSLLEQILDNPPHIHIGASGILVVDNKVLLGRRSADDKSFPGMLCTPGGGVNFGEAIHQAIVREFKEETHIDVEVAGRWQYVAERFNDEKLKHTVLVFREVRLASRLPHNLTPGEGFDCLTWLDPAFLDDYQENITVLTFQALLAFVGR